MRAVWSAEIRGIPESAGFCAKSGSVVYVVLGPCRSKSWFYELLAHETTHGFLGRYRTNRSVPIWRSNTA